MDGPKPSLPITQLNHLRMPARPGLRFKTALGYPSVLLNFSSTQAVPRVASGATAGERHPDTTKLLFLFENYALDTDRRELRHGAVVLPVEPQVFDLLAYLIKNRERVASKDDLVAAIWGGRIVSESALTSRINAARCAIGDTGAEQRLIKTFTRKGLRFVGAVGEKAKTKTGTVAAPGGAAKQKPKAGVGTPDNPTLD